MRGDYGWGFEDPSPDDHPNDQSHGIYDRQDWLRSRLAGPYRALALSIFIVNLFYDLSGPRVSAVFWHQSIPPQVPFADSLARCALVFGSQLREQVLYHLIPHEEGIEAESYGARR